MARPNEFIMTGFIGADRMSAFLFGGVSKNFINRPRFFCWC